MTSQARVLPEAPYRPRFRPLCPAWASKVLS